MATLADASTSLRASSIARISPAAVEAASRIAIADCSGSGGHFAGLGDHTLCRLIGRSRLLRQLLAYPVGVLHQRSDRAIEIARECLAFAGDDRAVELFGVALHDVEFEQRQPVDPR